MTIALKSEVAKNIYIAIRNEKRMVVFSTLELEEGQEVSKENKIEGLKYTTLCSFAGFLSGLGTDAGSFYDDETKDNICSFLNMDIPEDEILTNESEPMQKTIEEAIEYFFN